MELGTQDDAQHEQKNSKTSIQTSRPFRVPDIEIIDSDFKLLSLQSKG